MKKIKTPLDKLHNLYVKDYEKLYKESIDNPNKFWEKIANELEWYKPWRKALKWRRLFAKWFVGAKCNIIHNAIDRHINSGNGNKTALLWEGQDGTERKFSYNELNEQVCKTANAFKSLGITKGDRISIYLPRVPEQIIAMLASAKIGAIHSVVYCGFSVEALKTRVKDANAKIVITTDGYNYHEKLIKTKEIVDKAIKDIVSVKTLLVVRRLGNKVDMKDSRDIYYDELIAQQSSKCKTEQLSSDTPLFILYTSGTTGKPKGVIHVHGGYMVGIYITLKWIFNIHSNDVWWCTADPGWITGHSYIAYAPFICGTTQFFYEGPPLYPTPGKWWELIEKYKVTKFYSTPTAIRASMKYGEKWPQKYSLDSLKILGSVGEPINPEAWHWYYKYIGQNRCPIMDTWWQTETGMQMITSFPVTELKPGSAGRPFFGVKAEVVDKNGKQLPVNKDGFLVIKSQWPAMLRTLYKNKKRYKKVYFKEIKGAFFAGDAAKIDEDGYFWIQGRTDDVLKVSGYRFGTAELESAFVSYPDIVEAAVIGVPDEIKGEAIKAFVILKQGCEKSEELKKKIANHVRTEVGPIAKPREIDFVDSLPKTRSGKIMRRILKAKELGKEIGDTSTLEN
ncbi:acetate--CoA ligase [Patescibacteria group bacterium]|nr:acetate--CoA ligase [Patescibacteria group bacterium]